jgi:hypothetical protein
MFPQEVYYQVAAPVVSHSKLRDYVSRTKQLTIILRVLIVIIL